MANYKEHTKFNLFYALPVLLLCIYCFLQPHYYLLGTFAAVFVYSSIFMTPDLDVANQIKFFSLRGIMTIPFRSYACFFRHRGLSHNLLLGSATRIAWLCGWGCLLFFFYYRVLPNQSIFYPFYFQYKMHVLYALAAVCLADWSHLLLDKR